MHVVMQRENETNRVVLNGRRTDDGTLCTLVVVHELEGSWVFYPHGANQLGVRLSQEGAVKVAQEILQVPSEDMVRRAVTPSSPIHQPLAGPELFTWMALRRAHAGGVAWFEGSYFDSGRRVPCFLPEVFDTLIEAGLLTLADPDPDWPGGWRRASLTGEGHARFAVLNERNNQWVRRLMF